MKVTVCQLNDSTQGFAQDWEGLVSHVKQKASDLVLLPEMPFITLDIDPAEAELAKKAYPRNVLE